MRDNRGTETRRYKGYSGRGFKEAGYFALAHTLLPGGLIFNAVPMGEG